MKNKIAHFVSTFEYYEREQKGNKPYTIRDKTKLNKKKLENAGFICIHKGYTKANFIRKISDILEWKDNIIIAWRNDVQGG